MQDNIRNIIYNNLLHIANNFKGSIRGEILECDPRYIKAEYRNRRTVFNVTRTAYHTFNIDTGVEIMKFLNDQDLDKSLAVERHYGYIHERDFSVPYLIVAIEKLINSGVRTFNMLLREPTPEEMIYAGYKVKCFIPQFRYTCPNCGKLVNLTTDHVADMYYRHKTLPVCCTVPGYMSLEKQVAYLADQKCVYFEGKYTTTPDVITILILEDMKRDVVNYFNKVSKFRNKFRLMDNFTVKCKHRHIFNLNYKVTSANVDNEIQCPICEAEQKFELFKIIKDLDPNYYIKQIHYGNDIILPRLKKDERYLCKLGIFFLNDKKHLIGKIVFSDIFGKQQALANSNNIEFRWFEIQYINDREYCKTFLYEFFKNINIRFDLEEK